MEAHIRNDPNKLYNYMIHLSLIDDLAKHPTINFIPDPRSIKVNSGNSLIDYLQTALWFEKRVNTQIILKNLNSKDSFNIQFIDFITYIVNRYFEFNKDSDLYKLISPHIDIKKLFF